MPWHDTSCRDGLALVHQEDGRHPRSAPAARQIGRASVGGSGRMALKFLESAKWEIDLSGRVAPTSKVRKTLDTTHEPVSVVSLQQSKTIANVFEAVQKRLYFDAII